MFNGRRNFNKYLEFKKHIGLGLRKPKVLLSASALVQHKDTPSCSKSAGNYLF